MILQYICNSCPLFEVFEGSGLDPTTDAVNGFLIALCTPTCTLVFFSLGVAGRRLVTQVCDTGN